MLFVRHASTPGMRAARFPADEDADRADLIRAASLAGRLGNASVAWVSPAPAAAQTAAALGWEPRPVAALAEADHGRWRGLPYSRIAETEAEALAAWLADPDAAPHGGESLALVASRVAGWLESVRDQHDLVAVCDAGVIRAALGHALGLDPSRAARFDLAPLSTTRLAPGAGGWRVVHVNWKATS
ncbi:histidine phosphatase family protein [Nonomuraea turcica]|uniref:histidine phosphatase family protein n=1 Tax=Nonomuraea sp. G32 TaxID=3067274 RepID=UPI00273ABE1C|nr:histidine phosphatase family protein [Nonomuraea sp. G32]MDP4503751.1 histidine phosphatase family protein [Nonomuraea sp. G32]